MKNRVELEVLLSKENRRLPERVLKEQNGVSVSDRIPFYTVEHVQSIPRGLLLDKDVLNLFYQGNVRDAAIVALQRDRMPLRTAEILYGLSDDVR